MSSSLGRLAIHNNGISLGRTIIIPSAFSTLSGGGGRGRGRGSGPSIGSPNPQIGAAPTPPGKAKPDDSSSAEVDDRVTSGLGHGRGKPISSNPVSPTFPSWSSGINNPSTGRGRITQRPPQQQQQQPPQQQQQQQQPPQQQTDAPRKPIFFSRENSSESTERTPQFSDSGRNPEHTILPVGVSSGLPGAGRGKPTRFSGQEARANEENRHLRPRQPVPGPRRGVNIESQPRSSQSTPRLSREEAVKKAVGILSRGGGGAGREEGGRGRELGGRGGRGRGGRGFRGGRGRGGRGGGRFRDSEDDFASGLYLGDNADGERLATKVGTENMDKLVEGFEEMSSRVLPSPMDDAYMDALHTNNLIEYEPEYLMGEFGANPDIDEEPPIPLRDALEKMKPFLMAYEGIKDQEEWEEIMKETMEKVPHMKELIDIYCGPDRVTAKQQQKELERVAATLPADVPSSVKRFTDRALLSLQSNPGWGFDKKCQFMDKLVWEVSQHK